MQDLCRKHNQCNYGNIICGGPLYISFLNLVHLLHFHLSVIPNICYSVAFRLAGTNCLELKLASNLCQPAENLLKLSWLVAGDHFLKSQTSKLTKEIWRVHCLVYKFEILNRIYLNCVKIKWWKYVVLARWHTCQKLTASKRMT